MAAFALTQAIKPGRHSADIATAPIAPAATIKPRDAASLPDLRPTAPQLHNPSLPRPSELAAAPPIAATPSIPEHIAATLAPASGQTAVLPPTIELPASVSRDTAIAAAAPATSLETVPLTLGPTTSGAPLASANPQIAMLAPATAAPQETQAAHPPLPALIAREDGPNVCTLAPPRPAQPLPANLTPAAFGQALAAAARAQTAEFIIYNDKYRRIAYPMGDVQPLYGVCTDVVIRAYRALGIDLQQRVHESSAGGGDTSIEHRRTETLRRFFARYGRQLPPSTFAENFVPGDIVTYNRPQNRHSRSHIAVVSDVVAPSGRYMIVHNRGWGPQLEDGLFVDEITGHYRYTGAPEVPGAIQSQPVLAAATPAPRKRPVALASEALPISCRAGPRASQPRVACLRHAEAPKPRVDGAPVAGLGR